MKEEWRDIPDYGGYYQVSNHGRVRSLRRVIMRSNGAPQTIKARVLKPNRATGYHEIGLYKDGKGRCLHIHRLVLQAFVGDPPSGCECNHINGKKADNHLSNLEWITRSENMKHAFSVLGVGRDRVGEKTPNAKLTSGDVLAIRKAYASGNYAQKELARKYGVTQGNVGQIVNRITWKHI